MIKYNGLPLYEAHIDKEDNETGMFCISLVDLPATDCNFLAFGEAQRLLTYKVQDEEQHKVFGLVMAANLPIYRVDKSGYEYFVFYSRETLAAMAEKYFKEGFQNNMDTMHNFVMEDGITLTQMFFKDSAKGISPEGFEQYEDGSLFAEFHIENEEVWSKIKDGTYKGFSMAGYFDVQAAKEQEFNNQEKNTIKMKINKLKTMLRKMLAEFGEISTDKGVIVWDGEEELAEGVSVKSIDEEGNEIALEDGEYTEDKRVIVVKDGVVAEIRDIAEEEQPKDEEEAPANEEEKPAEEEEPKAEEEEPKAEEEPAAEEEEPKSEEEPAAEEDEKDKRIADLEAEIARLEEENGALKERIAELEKEPAAFSAEDEFSKEEKEKKVDAKAEALRKRGYKF